MSRYNTTSWDSYCGGMVVNNPIPNVIGDRWDEFQEVYDEAPYHLHTIWVSKEEGVIESVSDTHQELGLESSTRILMLDTNRGEHVHLVDWLSEYRGSLRHCRGDGVIISMPETWERCAYLPQGNGRAMGTHTSFLSTHSYVSCDVDVWANLTYSWGANVAFKGGEHRRFSDVTWKGVHTWDADKIRASALDLLCKQAYRVPLGKELIVVAPANAEGGRTLGTADCIYYLYKNVIKYKFGEWIGIPGTPLQVKGGSKGMLNFNTDNLIMPLLIRRIGEK